MSDQLPKGRQAWEGEMLRLLAENVRDYAIFVIDSQWRIQSWSAGAERLFGYRRDEILGESGECFFTPEDLQQDIPRREIEQALSAGFGEDERWHVRKDGSRFWCSGTIAPLWDKNGELRGLAKIMRDRTEWREAELARRESDARKAAVLETALDGIITIDHEDRVVEFNPAAERLFGYHREDILGRKMAELIIPPRLRRAHYQAMAGYLATGEGSAFGKRLKLPAMRADGSEFPAELAITRVPLDGAPLFTGYIRDITDREAQERRQTAQLAVTQVLADSVTVQDAARRILQTICGSLDWDIGAVWLVDQRASGLCCLELQYSPLTEAARFEQASREQVFAPGRGLPGRVWDTAEPLWLSDISRDENFPRLALAAEVGLQTAFAVPILLGTETLGVIEFLSKSRRALDSDLLGMLATVGGQFGQFMQRRRAEGALRESEQQFRTSFELAAVGTVQLDPATGRFLQVNRKFCEITGYTPAELRKLTVRDITHPDESEREWEKVSRMLRGEVDSYASDKRYVRKDGKPVWVNATASLVRDSDGRPLRTIGVVQDLSERKRAEQELQESRRLLQNILDNTPAMIYVKNRQGRLLHVNRRFAEVAGKPVEQIIGKTDREVFGGALEGALENDRLVFQKGQVMQFEERLRLAEKVYTYLSVKAPVEGNAYDDTVLIGITTDVTEWKRSEQELRDREATLRAYYANAPLLMGVVEITEDDILHIYDNPATCRFFGSPEAEHFGRWASELGAPPAAIQLWLEKYRQSEARNAPVQFEYSHEKPGEARWLSATVTWLGRGVSGRPRFCYLAEDVTEQRAAIEALQDSEERFRGIVSHSIAGVAEVDLAGRFLFANERYCEIVGRRWEELRHLSMQDISHQDDLKENLPLFERMARDGTPYIIEKRYLRPDGSQVWVNNSVSGLRGPDGKIKSIVAVCVDVTARRQAEEGLREASRRKDEFLAMLGHELRNPLAPLRSGLELLSLEQPSSDVVGLMKGQIDHLVRLVDDLLDVSRIMRGKIELRRQPIELATVIAKAINTAQPAIEGQHHELTCDLPSQPIWIEADAVRLTQVFANLLNNAAKYSPPRGRIWITAEADQEVVFVRIRDAGIGIDPALLPAIFDLFTQGDRTIDRAQGGLGIGLTVVKNLVEMHHGAVAVHSEGAGTGTEFVVQLPVRSRPRKELINQKVARTERGFRILAVDDNLAAATMLKRLLSKLGPHDVRLDHDGPSALKSVEKDRPQIILLDIGLPGMSGYDVARRIRATPENSGVLLVALTGYGTADDREQSRAAGFDEHLVKPADLKALRQLMEHPKIAEQSRGAFQVGP